MEQKLASDQSYENGQQPQKHLQNPPANSSRVFICDKRKTVSNNNNIGFCLAVRNWVLGEYQEVEEDDQVSHDHARPRMLEIVAEVFTHPSSLRCCLSCMRKDTRLKREHKPSLSPLLPVQTCNSSTGRYVGKKTPVPAEVAGPAWKNISSALTLPSSLISQHWRTCRQTDNHLKRGEKETKEGRTLPKTGGTHLLIITLRR